MTEKKLWTLSVDEEFKALIPPLSAEERQMLEESIAANGCEMPILVWNDTIVDGHNRYAICHEHGIPFAKEEKQFQSRSDVKLWMLRNQLGRRNLNSFQRAEIALRYEAALAEEAEARMKSGVEANNPGPNLAQGIEDMKGEKKHSEDGRTSVQLGRLAGVGKTTMKKAKKIINEADEATKEQLRQGKATIHGVYNELVNRDHDGETRICERCHQEKPVAAFSMPSDRTSFSPLCKDCEREVEEAARSAAKVASETTEPVETYPVQGMAIYKGHPIHIGSVPEDKPEMFTQVQGLLDFAVHGYLADVREAMKWFGPNMRTPDNVEKVEALIMNTCESALKLLHENDQKDEQEKED